MFGEPNRFTKDPDLDPWVGRAHPEWGSTLLFVSRMVIQPTFETEFARFERALWGGNWSLPLESGYRISMETGADPYHVGVGRWGL